LTIKDKEKVNIQLAAARAKIVKTGKSPRQLGNESRQKLFDWIYNWGYTTPAICQLLMERTTGGYLRKLAAQNSLVETTTKSGSPAAYFTLTKLGLEEAERNANCLLKYIEIDPFKVDQLKIRHNLMAQKCTLQALNSNLIVEYETEKMNFKSGDKLGVKRPDVTWVTSSGLRLGVEIELSAKWDKDLDQFILGIARALQSAGDENPAYNRFIMISDSRAIIKRYTTAMQPGSPLSVWAKNNRGHWAIERTMRVPGWLINKVDFQLLED